jgi:hypothetical protein
MLHVCITVLWAILLGCALVELKWAGKDSMHFWCRKRYQNSRTRYRRVDVLIVCETKGRLSVEISSPVRMLRHSISMARITEHLPQGRPHFALLRKEARIIRFLRYVACSAILELYSIF